MFWKKSVIDTDEKKIEELLTRGVEDIFVKDSLLKKLRSGKQLRVKLGIDPTSPHIHLGRAVVLRKLKAFQDLGHKIVLIVGDFTAQIGDASDKLEKRPMLSLEKVKENLKTYKKQIGKIINVNDAEFHFNSSWLSNLTFQEIAILAESFSISQMTSRRNFSERIEKGQEVSLREFLYPLMQGYDSVAVGADVEIGGFDQLFNLKAGRIIQRHYHKPEQDILTLQMIEGIDGRKMSSSWGNIVSIDDEVNDMYGKIMSIKDDLITKYFLLATDVSPIYIKEIEEKLARGSNPKEIKMELAREIVKLYHGEKNSLKAEAHFVSVFSKKNIPEEIQTAQVQVGAELRETVVDLGLVPSKSEYMRLLDQGAIHNLTTGQKIEDSHYKIMEEAVFKIGKKIFIKITPRKE